MRLLALLPVAIALACSSPSQPAKAEPPVNQQQIVNRVTNDIWPAIENYSYVQASPGHRQFATVVDPDLFSDQDSDQYAALRKAVQAMGRRGEYDKPEQTTHDSSDWKVANVDITSATDKTATLNVCYTYDHSWYVNISDTHHAPGASEAAVTLTNVNNTWYLHGIANDHVVQGCSSDKA